MLIINILNDLKGFLFCVFIGSFMFSCSEEESKDLSQNDDFYNSTEKNENIEYKIKKLSETQQIEKIDTLEQRLINAGLVDAQEIDSSLMIDVKYSSEDNFMKTDLYGNLNKIYLQKEVAERLSLAQKALKEKDSTLSLLIYDGVRPRSVQQRMWDSLDTIPFQERIKFVSNPKNGSIHNYGCAVDLTIFDIESNETLDMGAGYDDLRKIAYPRHEEAFLESGDLTKEQYKNRVLLRSVMRKGGFWVIPTEWWHFNAFTREKAIELYEIVN